MKMFRFLAFSALLAMSVSFVNAQDFDKGEAAYKAGDYQAAFKEWIFLAEGGDAFSQSLIGSMYENGIGVIQDYSEAVKWYRLAADQGNISAQLNIGTMYRKGEGVRQSDVEAVKWFRLAANQGDANAQYKLGLAYTVGIGVIENNVMAHMWLNIASANGEENSAKWRNEIALKMTPEAIEKAQAMAQECISSGYKICGD